MKIRFTREYKVKAEDGPVYKQNEVVEVTPESAQHFINRGAAEKVEDTVKRMANKASSLFKKVHRGRGVFDVQDSNGNVVAGKKTGEEADQVIDNLQAGRVEN